MTAADPSIELMRLINGYRVSQALRVAATLGVADQLKDGPKSYDAVAQACGANPASLYRLLRALAAVGVFHETGNKEFSLTPLGVCLTSDAPGSTCNYARWIGTPGQWGSWGNLLHSIKSGESALRFTYGMDAWTYRMQHLKSRLFSIASKGVFRKGPEHGHVDAGRPRAEEPRRQPEDHHRHRAVEHRPARERTRRHRQREHPCGEDRLPRGDGSRKAEAENGEEVYERRAHRNDDGDGEGLVILERHAS